MSVDDVDSSPTLYLKGDLRRRRAYYESAALLVLHGVLLLVDGVDRLLVTEVELQAVPLLVWIGTLLEVVMAMATWSLALPAFVLALDVSTSLCRICWNLHPLLALLFVASRIVHSAVAQIRRPIHVFGALSTAMLRGCILTNVGALYIRLRSGSRSSIDTSRRFGMLSFAALAIASACAFIVAFDSYLLSKGDVLSPLLTLFATLLLLVAAISGLLVAYSGDIRATRVTVAISMPINLTIVAILAVVHPLLKTRVPFYEPFADVSPSSFGALLAVAMLTGPYCIVRVV